MSSFYGTLTPIANRQQHLVDEFLLFDNWAERYQYIIDLGIALAPFPDYMRTEENRIAGCHSETYLSGERSNGRLRLLGASDMPVLAGLLAIAIRVYSNEAPGDILRHPPKLLDSIGLTQMLSPPRRVALLNIYERLIVLASKMPDVKKLTS